jgi:hypothetical protein
MNSTVGVVVRAGRCRHVGWRDEEKDLPLLLDSTSRFA